MSSDEEIVVKSRRSTKGDNRGESSERDEGERRPARCGLTSFRCLSCSAIMIVEALLYLLSALIRLTTLLSIRLLFVLRRTHSRSSPSRAQALRLSPRSPHTQTHSTTFQSLRLRPLPHKGAHLPSDRRSAREWRTRLLRAS